MAWFDCATRRQISNNIGGNMSSQRGLVLHHQAGNGSLYGFFNSPSAQVSAHFWVSKSGTIEQYVDTARVAWHGRDLNSNWVGVETEGCPGGRDEPMTDAMFNALVRLYREGNRRHGWPNQLASSNGGRGFGYHRMAVNTACPCDVRLNRRSAILSAAFGSGGAAPPVTPPKEEADMSASSVIVKGELHMACVWSDGRVNYKGPTGSWYAVDSNAANKAKSGAAITANQDTGLLIITFTNAGGKVCTWQKAATAPASGWTWYDRGGSAR